MAALRSVGYLAQDYNPMVTLGFLICLTIFIKLSNLFKMGEKN